MPLLLPNNGIFYKSFNSAMLYFIPFTPYFLQFRRYKYVVTDNHVLIRSLIVAFSIKLTVANFCLFSGFFAHTLQLRKKRKSDCPFFAIDSFNKKAEPQLILQIIGCWPTFKF